MIEIASQQNNEARARQMLAQIDQMEGHEFENWCAWLLSHNGFNNVEVTLSSGDQGVDVIAYQRGKKYAIQCKRYKTALGNKPVQEVFTGMRVYKCDVGAVMTNNYFTSGGKQAAEATKILLWDRDVISGMLNEAIKKEKRKEAKRPEPVARRGHNKRNMVCGLIVVAIIAMALLYHFRPNKELPVDSTQSPVISETTGAPSAKSTASPTQRPKASATAADTEPSANKQTLLDRNPVVTLEGLRFGMNQTEVRRIFGERDVALTNEDGENGRLYFGKNIIAPAVYAEGADNLGVCVNQYAHPENYKYLSQKVDTIRLYYAYNDEKGRVIRDMRHSMLYAVKLTLSSTTPQRVFQSLDRLLRDRFGDYKWQGTRITSLYGKEDSSAESRDIEYHIWTSDRHKMIVALSGRSDRSHRGNRASEVEVSLISYNADSYIKETIKMLQK